MKTKLRLPLWALALGGALAALTLAPTAAQALNVGYYGMCSRTGRPGQATAITAAGQTPVNLTELTPAQMAPVDILFIDNCDNAQYDSLFLAHVTDVANAVASGKFLILHDRYVDPAETILPGGSSFDIRRFPVFPDPNLEDRNIDVIDNTTLITNGPAGTINDTTLDGGNSSDHGFTVIGSLPGATKRILSTNDHTHVVTFVYGYGLGAVMYSSIPLDYYVDGGGPNSNFRTIYAPNVIAYAAALLTSCGNGVLDPGEECDIGAATGGPGTCCSGICTIMDAGAICRPAVDGCDHAETCAGGTTVCPADGPEPAGTVCRAAAGACDVAETCNGTSFSCPADVKVSAGVECRAAASECDVAEICDGTNPACPADEQKAPGVACTDDGDACTADQCNGAGLCLHNDLPDSDSDGVCDEQDACTNLGGFRNFLAKPKPRLMFTKVNNETLPGNDSMRINAEFVSAFHTPIADGVRILVTSHDGSTRVDQTLPPSIYAGRGTRGWKSSANGFTWNYIDNTGSPLSGITRMKIVYKAINAHVRVSVSGTRWTYPVVAADVPLKVDIVLGGQAEAEQGRCGESAFSASSCNFNSKGTTLTCR